LVQFVPRWAHHLDVSGLRWCGVRAASDGTWARSSARFANIAPTMLSWLGLRSCGPSSPHQLSESRAVHLTPALYWPNRGRWRTSKTNGSWRGAPA